MPVPAYPLGRLIMAGEPLTGAAPAAGQVVMYAGRRDGLHKLTTGLAREHGTVVVEDLNVSGMLTNRRLARHIADAALAEVRRQLAYKAAWNGGRLLVADRWYPSSKTCSACGAVKAKLALSGREYRCEQRGLVIDRDRNAALNLAALAARVDTAGSASGSDRDRPTGRWDHQSCTHQSVLKGNGSCQPPPMFPPRSPM
jgi:IS605 OrfB family transposase